MVETKPYKSEENSWHPLHRRIGLDTRKHYQANGRGVTFCALVKCVFGPRHTFMQLLKIITLVALSITCLFNLKLIFETKNRLDQEQLLLDSDYIFNSHHLEGRDSYMHEDELDDFHKNKVIEISVLSSQQMVKIVVNNMTVHLDTDEEMGRGIHLVVIHQVTGKVMAENVFDTFQEHQDESMAKFIEMISNSGRILVFAVKDEASFQLKENARNVLKSLGSNLIGDLKWRGMWAMVCSKAGLLFAEDISHADDTASWGNPIKLHVKLKSQENSYDLCEWPSSDESEKRKRFCMKYEGYGNLCSCNNPDSLKATDNNFPENLVYNIPIAIIASNRPHYLHRTLKSLLNADGANIEMIVVFIDGQFQEPMDLCKLYGIKSFQHNPVGVQTSRISQHYKASLTGIFNVFPHAKYTIILEDDLDVSPDFFRYFSQTMPLLEKDDSLYCVSAWNDQGYKHSCQDPSLLYRVESMPGLGWMLKRSLYKEELEPNWPSPEKPWDWDMWMRHDSVRKGRECVIPDVSRTFHFGVNGINMNPRFFDLYFKNHVLNNNAEAELQNVNHIQEQEYERLMHSLVRGGTVLDHTKTPCDEDFISETTHPTSNVYVAYFRMESSTSTSVFIQISKCLKIWDLDARGLHRASFRTFIKNRHVVFVGYPTSPYSIYKPVHVNPIYIEFLANEG